MTRDDDDIFPALFLEAKDMPSQMTLYGDHRIGLANREIRPTMIMAGSKPA